MEIERQLETGRVVRTGRWGEEYSVDINKFYELYYICRKLRRSSERAWRGGMREVPAGHAIVSLDGRSWKRARRDGKRVRSSAAVCQSQRRLAEATIGTATPVQHPADRLGEVLPCSLSAAGSGPSRLSNWATGHVSTLDPLFLFLYSIGIFN